MSEQSQSNEKNEKRLMIQGGLLFTYPTLFILYWHVGPRTLTSVIGSMWVSVTGELFWISNGAINPVIYLMMNKWAKFFFHHHRIHFRTLRNRVKQLLGINKNAVTTVRKTPGRNRTTGGGGTLGGSVRGTIGSVGLGKTVNNKKTKSTKATTGRIQEAWPDEHPHNHM